MLCVVYFLPKKIDCLRGELKDIVKWLKSPNCLT